MSNSYEAALRAGRNRNRIYDAIVKAIEVTARSEGLTGKAIAEAIGCKPDQITQWLSGPGNWTLDTVSDLLFAIKAEMNYNIVFDKDQTKPDVHNMAGSTVSSTAGTNRPHLIDVPLSDEELAALEAMVRATELSRDRVIRHALRTYHAGLLRPEPIDPSRGESP